MVGQFMLPPTGFGPGSQPLDGDGELAYMSMPEDMRTFTARIPDVAYDERFSPALTLLGTIAAAARSVSAGGLNQRFRLADLDAGNRALIAETMGEGEVSMRIWGTPAVDVQESVFAGVWILKWPDGDVIEVGPVPDLARNRAFEPRKTGQGAAAPKGPGVVNAQPLFVELADKSAAFAPGSAVHTVNLTLLPHTEEDLAWLDTALGTGSVDILSRGYGNCRVTATALPYVWRVQFFNSMDTLILDTFEVSAMPEVALAAPEDLADSAGRILEVLEAIR